MKKIFLSLVANFTILAISAQQELHIHHINIENGDATLIGIYDVAQEKYISKILIDGGQSKPNEALLPYITKMVGNNNESFHFEYIILTHYHTDHYKGLLAIKDGSITADSIIDPGGYKVNTVFNHTANSGTKPAHLEVRKVWLNALRDAADHSPQPFVKGRSKILIRFGTTATTTIGNKIHIGKVGSNNVELRCIAGWGNTLSENGEIIPNPKPGAINGNNYTLAFVLSCGQFRYFIGGDMGGETVDKYIDQESPSTKFFEDEYPKSVSIDGNTEVKGHICGFKANHHGSNHSNMSSFMQKMHPAITITSAGDLKSWHLPGLKYLDRLDSVQPLSTAFNSSDSTFKRGVYFTNLYDFSASFISLTRANDLFTDQPGISYDFGNNSNDAKGSYLIKVRNGEGIGEKSQFEVGRVDINEIVPYKILAFFSCHAKD